jgi:hypothetical protein
VSWLQIDDQILRHPKFVRAQRLAGSTALHLWIGFTAYCKQQQSDGRVPADMIETVDGPDKRWRPRALAALVEVKLVEYDGADLLVHDYLDWNESRAAISVKNAARQAARQAGRPRPPAPPRALGERRVSVGPNVGGASDRALGESNDNGHLIPVGTPSSSSSSSSDQKPPCIPPTDPAPSSPTVTKKLSSHSSGKRVCPADLDPNPAVLKLAAELGYSAELERSTRAEFVDWWRGDGRMKADWQATYRNRLRFVAKRDKLKPVKHDPQREHYQAQLRAATEKPSSVVPVPREYASKVRSLFS